MQVLKFLLGILLVQLITAILISISPINFDNTTAFLQLITPLFFVALMLAFWFSSLSASFQKETEHKLNSKFAKEREKLKVKAERDKIKVVKEAQKEIATEAKMTHAKANFKVGMAFAGVMGVGALFIFAQLITVGLLTLTTTVGAMGGYYWRGKRLANNTKPKELDIIETKVIET